MQSIHKKTLVKSIVLGLIFSTGAVGSFSAEAKEYVDITISGTGAVTARNASGTEEVISLRSVQDGTNWATGGVKINAAGLDVDLSNTHNGGLAVSGTNDTVSIMGGSLNATNEGTAATAGLQVSGSVNSVTLKGVLMDAITAEQGTAYGISNDGG